LENRTEVITKSALLGFCATHRERFRLALNLTLALGLRLGLGS